MVNNGITITPVNVYGITNGISIENTANGIIYGYDNGISINGVIKANNDGIII